MEAKAGNLLQRVMKSHRRDEAVQAECNILAEVSGSGGEGGGGEREGGGVRIGKRGGGTRTRRRSRSYAVGRAGFS